MVQWVRRCNEAMKKNLTINTPGDDHQNRLLSYLKEQVPFHIHSINRIRSHVFFVKSKKVNFILKGFSSYHRMKLQESFTESLKKEGFNKTYHFLNIFKDPPMLFDKKYYGCLEYITPSKEMFSYYQEKDRLEGLRLLRSFHHRTEKLVNRYQRLIPTFQLIDKWKERTNLFLDNLRIIQFFIKEDYTQELIRWANWSFKGLEKEQGFFNHGNTVILHGDVAHHNFLRNQSNDLSLIDFDLIAIGKEKFDYLQYANRILPYLGWSLLELRKYEGINENLSEKGFLYALAFPTDIMREWNRIIKEKSYNNPKRVRPIIELTTAQFHMRKEFIKEIQLALKDL